MTFRKGESGNAAGKKKGCLNETTRKLLESRTLLKENSILITHKLVDFALQGEPWAIQAALKELPKATQDQFPIDIPEGADIDMTIEAFQRALKNKTMYTHSEILDSLKILNSIKLNTSIDKSINNDMKLLKDEEVSSMVALINKRKEEIKKKEDND